jgi:hypothetical protein
MSENYNGCCAMCKYFDLYDKHGFMSDKYRCTRVDQYFPWREKQCGKFVSASGSAAEREQLIEKARANRL